jgi:hypothetical protein
MSFPVEVGQKQPVGSPLRHRRASSHGNQEKDVIHVDDPKHPLHHPDGFAPTPAPEEIEPTFQDDEEEEEPILAADEVRPESAYLHPAISPTFDRRGSFEDEHRSRTPSASHSRSNSRSTSAQGQFPVLTRFDSREDPYTPLEDVEEYEPLFPDEDSKKERPMSAADRFKKRPDALRHRFPSQDVWEDTPDSLQLHATVTTPDLPKRESTETFETPEQEAHRRMQTTKVNSHQVASHILEGESSREKLQRPDTFKQRFPSRDIWEDAPDSQQLVTTVEPAKEEVKSPEVPSRPSLPPRPQKQAQATSPVEKRQPPSIPERPKPQVPARPAKTIPQPSTGAEETSREAPAVKAKPAVPARPGGNKIAALKAGFLTDLNSRIGMGPQQPKPQPKEPEPAAEKQPLSDARKGRARGPARRKPAVEQTTPKLPTIPEIKISEAMNVWQIGHDGNLTVGKPEKEETLAAVPEPKPEQELPSEKPVEIPMQSTTEEPVEPKSEPSSGDLASSPGTTKPVLDTMQISAEAPEAIEASSGTKKPIIDPPTKSSVEPTSESGSPKEGIEGGESKPSEMTGVAQALSGSTGVAQALADSTSAARKLDDALETLAASADGKRESDGHVHEE